MLVHLSSDRKFLHWITKNILAWLLISTLGHAWLYHCYRNQIISSIILLLPLIGRYIRLRSNNNDIFSKHDSRTANQQNVRNTRFQSVAEPVDLVILMQKWFAECHPTVSRSQLYQSARLNEAGGGSQHRQERAMTPHGGGTPTSRN